MNDPTVAQVQLVSALKAAPRTGCSLFPFMLFVRLANTACSLKDSVCEATTFPIEVVSPKKILEEATFSQLVRDEDKDHGFFMIGDDFKVVVTCSFTADEAYGYLKDAIPLEDFEVICVKPGSPPPKWKPAYGEIAKYRATPDAEAVLCEVLKYTEDDEAEDACSIKLADGKTKFVPTLTLKPAPEGSVMPVVDGASAC